MIGSKFISLNIDSTGLTRFKNYLHNQSGTTLMELMVALSIFSFTMVSALGIFQSVVAGQSYAIAALNTQETLRYDFEMIAKEIRTAVESNGSCAGVCGVPASSNTIFYADAGNNILCFKNEKDQCVKYYLNSGRLRIYRDTIGDYPITPDEVAVSELFFSIQNNSSSQPRVTMKLKIEAISKAVNKQTMILQQTVSSRFYE